MSRLRVQLHLHTIESKGTRITHESVILPKQAIYVLKRNRINAFVITDHNTTRAYPKLKKCAKRHDILAINGIEIDTLDGHLIGLGVEDGIDEKLKKYMSAEEACDLIRDFGGEIYIPHPFDIREKGIGTKIKEIDGIVEVFNSMNIFGFEDLYANIVATRLGKPKGVGADAHTLAMIPLGITVMNCEPDQFSILKNLRKGNVRFENCRYLTLREIKEWALQRISLSYQDIKNRIKYGWDIDIWYMIFANNQFLRYIENTALEVGVRRMHSNVWDLVSYVCYAFAVLYAKKTRKEYDIFLSSF